VRGDRRDADAGAEIEARSRRERERPLGGDDGVLLGGAARRAAVAGQGHPDAILDAEAVDARADLVDDACAVVIRDRLVQGSAAGLSTARLPVGRVDARDGDADPDLALTGLRNRALDLLEHRSIALARVDHRPHGRTVSRVRATTARASSTSRIAPR
jgi:hypothetical protein